MRMYAIEVSAAFTARIAAIRHVHPSMEPFISSSSDTYATRYTTAVTSDVRSS